MLSRKRKLSEVCDSKPESKARAKMMRLNDGTKVSVTHQASLPKQVASPSPAEDQTEFVEKTTPTEKNEKTEPAVQALKEVSKKSVAAQDCKGFKCDIV